MGERERLQGGRPVASPVAGNDVFRKAKADWEDRLFGAARERGWAESNASSGATGPAAGITEGGTSAASQTSLLAASAEFLLQVPVLCLLELLIAICVKLLSQLLVEVRVLVGVAA